eukprot:gene14369-16956_t
MVEMGGCLSISKRKAFIVRFSAFVAYSRWSMFAGTRVKLKKKFLTHHSRAFNVRSRLQKWLTLKERESEMGGSGRIFGKQITYTVSPFHQKLFVNYFKNAIPHLKRGVRENFFATVPYFIALGVTVNWANHSYHHSMKESWY